MSPPTPSSPSPPPPPQSLTTAYTDGKYSPKLVEESETAAFAAGHDACGWGDVRGHCDGRGRGD